MSLIVFGGNETATRVFVEAVHNSGTFPAADTGKVRAMMQKRIHQSVLGIAGARMNNQSGGFIDHDQIRVFVNDLERYRLRFGRDFLRWWFGYPDLITGPDQIAGPGWFAIHRRCTGANKLLNSGPGELRQPIRYEPVEPASGVLLWYR